MQKEYYTGKNKGFTVNIVNNQIDSVRKKETIRRSVRLNKDNVLGISGTQTDLEFSELEKRAEQSLSAGVPIEYSFPDGDSREWDIRQKKFEDEEILKITENILSKMTAAYPEFIFSNKIMYSDNMKYIKNTEGVDYTVKSNRLSIGLVWKHKESTGIMDGFWGNDYGTDIDTEQFVQRAKPFMEKFNTVKDIDDSSITVLFPEYTSSMPFRFLRAHINGESIQKGASYFKDNVGNKVFSDDFSLYDVNIHEDEGICSPFDGDGYRRDEKSLPVFENGVFVNPLYDLKRAQKYDKKPTGTSSRAYNSTTSISANLLMVPETDMYLKDIERAVIVLMSSGGDYQDNGDISMPVQLGYLVENGEITGRVPDIILTNNIDKLFNEHYIGALHDGLFEDRLSKYIGFKMNINKG